MMEFLENNQMYIVLGISLLIWAGIVSLLFSLSRKIKSIERRILKG